MRTVHVAVPKHPYDVHVGRGARAQLAGLLPASARRAAIVTQHGVPRDLDPGMPCEVIEIGAGEQHKSLATVEAIAERCAAFGLTRNDVIIAVGGGMVTDVAGFAAATWHRGVPVVHVATTLLSMIDAAIGGKTGVNLAAGKNLVGSFWQPDGVICDLDHLDSLPERERRSGNGEMAKYHFLTGDDVTDLGTLDLEARVARCVEIKAGYIVADEREGGSRALLNYGHTLAHALETATNHQLSHGEAVGVGLVFAARLAQHLGRIDESRVDEHRHVVVDRYGLDEALPAGVDHDQLVELMARDKKALDGLTFVLDGVRGVEVVPQVPAGAVREALASTARTA